MPISMRRQTKELKRRAERNIEVAKQRSQAIQLLKEKSFGVRTISRTTGVPKSTVALLKKTLDTTVQDKVMLQAKNVTNGGRRRVLTHEEENMIVERIKIAAERGFAIDYEGIRSIMARIAADSRQGWRNEIPSYDAIRSFRARHRDITCRQYENKDHSKLAAESFQNVESFFAAIEKVCKTQPHILDHPDYFWNMDETSVSALEGKKKKVFSGTHSNHGGFRGNSTSYGISKHVTAVVAVSASGLIAPPFFIVAGKRISSRWLDPVKGSFNNLRSGICSRYTKRHWFPSNGVIKVTGNGSMEIPVMTPVIKHIDNYTRQYCHKAPYLLLLDGHSSRKGIEWIEECIRRNCEAVVSPANTSHFLQACDQTVNRRFNEAVKELRDEFCKHGAVDTKRVNFNLACGVYDFNQIKASDITNYFKATVLCPFDIAFPLRFRTAQDALKQEIKEEAKRLERGGLASRLGTVIKRRRDEEVLKELKEVFKSQYATCRQIQQLSIILKNAETTNSILMSVGSQRSDTCGTAVSDNVEKSVMLNAGAPTEWVTVGEVLLRRKEKEAEVKRMEQLKETENAQKAAEKQKKLLHAMQRKDQMAQKRALRACEKLDAKRRKQSCDELARSAASLWRLCSLDARTCGTKRVSKGSKVVVPYVSSFKCAASLVLGMVEVAMELGNGS